MVKLVSLKLNAKVLDDRKRENIYFIQAKDTLQEEHSLLTDS